jgi:hypothetical protein
MPGSLGPFISLAFSDDVEVVVEAVPSDDLSPVLEQEILSAQKETINKARTITILLPFNAWIYNTPESSTYLEFVL